MRLKIFFGFFDFEKSPKFRRARFRHAINVNDAKFICGHFETKFDLIGSKSKKP